MKTVRKYVAQRGLLTTIKLTLYWIYYEFVFSVDSVAHNARIVQNGGEVRVRYEGSQQQGVHIREASGTKAVRARKIYDFENVKVAAYEWGCLIQGDHYVFNPLDTNPFNNQSYRRATSTVENNPKYSFSTGYLIYESHLGFGHWQSEVLTQCRYVELIESQVQELKIILATRAPIDHDSQWKVETMKMLGIEPDFTIYDGPFEIDRLYVPTYTPLGNGEWIYPPPSELRWVSNNLLSGVPGNSTKRSRVFISRAGVNKRKIVNFNQIETILNEYDFEILRPERLSQRHQAELFSTAEIVCGPAGSGFMRTTYSDNVTLLELIPNTGSNHATFVLANLLNIDYDYIYCNSVPGSHPSPRHRDIIVDPEKLRKLFEQHLN